MADVKVVAKNPVRKLPKFKRQNVDQKKRVGDAWRKPRGIDNKQRIKEGGYGYLPKIGYRSARAGRGFHPSGLPEILIHTVGELNAAKGTKVVVRIGSTVGARKRALINAEAKKLGLRILNK